MMAKLQGEERELQSIMLAPEDAMRLLEHNTLNRPLSQTHVTRIADQIATGRWKFNGDSIKIAKTGDVLDGQHRLWAIIESKRAVETVVVKGIEKDAFSTIDTIRKSRSGSDTLTLLGAKRHRGAIAGALTWLMRYQGGDLENYRAPENRIENSDVETAYKAHPEISRAAERCCGMRRLVNTSIMTFIYYLLSNRDQELAERLIKTLENPAGAALEDPFYRFRAYLTADHHQHKDALMTIALAIKSINAASSGKTVKVLSWKSQGKTAEPFPILEI